MNSTPLVLRYARVAIVGFGVSFVSHIASAQLNSNSELHLCRNGSDADDKIAHCVNVIATSRDRVALEIAHNTLGHAYMEVQNFLGAVQQFTEVIRLNPKIAGYFDNRQNAYRRAGQFGLAMADANKAIEMAPSYAFVYRGRANVYNDMGNYTDAIEDYTRAIQIDPTDGGLFIDRGKILRSAKLFDQAIADFSHALEIDKKWVAAYRERGLTNKQMGNFEPARSDFHQYLQLWPQDDEVLQALKELPPPAMTGLPSDPTVSPAKLHDLNPTPMPTTNAPQRQTVVPMEMDSGAYIVPVTVNGQITLKFVVDSGASEVSIPSDVVSTLKRTGTISDSDFLDGGIYVLADGSKVPSERFSIRSLKVGDTTLENVTASVAPASGALLLGQSFLNRFASWSIDNTRHALLLTLKDEGVLVAAPTSPPNDQAVNSSAGDFYKSVFFLSGVLGRSAAVCGGDWRKTTDISLDLIAAPELKAVSNGVPDKAKQWLADGATNFNTGVMTDGLIAACEHAFQLRGEAESIVRKREQ